MTQAPRQGWAMHDFMKGKDLAKTIGYAQLALEHGVNRDHEGPAHLQQYSSNRYYRDRIANGHTVLKHAPHLWTLCYAMRLLAEVSCDQLLQFSPWTQSAVAVKRCAGDAAEHGWHRDYNDITAILYLTHGEPLEVLAPGVTPDTEDHERYTSRASPKPGHVLVLNGKEQFHRVPRHDARFPRDAVVFNFYLADNHDPQRPPGLDESLFGAAQGQ